MTILGKYYQAPNMPMLYNGPTLTQNNPICIYTYVPSGLFPLVHIYTRVYLSHAIEYLQHIPSLLKESCLKKKKQKGCFEIIPIQTLSLKE